MATLAGPRDTPNPVAPIGLSRWRWRFVCNKIIRAHAAHPKWILRRGCAKPWFSVHAGLLIEPPNVRIGSILLIKYFRAVRTKDWFGNYLVTVIMFHRNIDLYCFVVQTPSPTDFINSIGQNR